MTTRTADEELQALAWQGEIVSTSQSGAGEITTTIDDETGNVELPAETWGQAGLVSRVLDGGADGYAKALRIQLGESVLVISTYDPRHHVACEPGEVIIHALSKEKTSRALIRLKPNGVVEIEGEKITVNGDDDSAALASKLDALAHDVALHTHSTPSGTAVASTLLSDYGTPWTSASSDLKLGG